VQIRVRSLDFQPLIHGASNTKMLIAPLIVRPHESAPWVTCRCIALLPSTDRFVSEARALPM
jgi:hypothetical protein